MLSNKLMFIPEKTSFGYRSRLSPAPVEPLFCQVLDTVETD